MLISAENLRRVRALAPDRRPPAGRRSPRWRWHGSCVTTRVTSALIGVSGVAQLEDNVAALAHLEFDDEELAAIDQQAQEGEINIWSASSEA